MRITKKGIAAFVLAVALPVSAFASDSDLQQKIEELSRQLESLRQQVQQNEAKTKQTEEKVDKTEALAKQTEEKSLGRWLSISGDYRFRIDNLRGNVGTYYQYINNTTPPMLIPGYAATNDTIYTNRFGLNLKVKATEDVQLKARLLMYKVSGAQNDNSVIGPFFADRVGIFDGTLGHVPSDGQLTVDQVYVTWSNILDQPLWFSVGRRPSAGGTPSNLRANTERVGTAGIPALLVDYAFDGMTIGYAPDIDALGSPYIKLCYGRAFESGYTQNSQPMANNSLRDTDMLGVQAVVYNTDAVMATLQWNHGFNIFNSPAFLVGQSYPYLPLTAPSVNVGDIDWFGGEVTGKVEHAGPGTFNWFIDSALSITEPNHNTAMPGMPIGLNYSGVRTRTTGWAAYVGGRYDFPKTGTKIGLEYNHGSENWITFAPAADDMWTAKLGTRGNVYEIYGIQELPLKPISSLLSKVFFKLGYQYYQFNYTGSNNWVGGSTPISNVVNPMNAQMFAPVKNAQDVYGTFEVQF